MPREYILAAARNLSVHAPRQVPGTASSFGSHSTLDNIARGIVRTQPYMRSADHQGPGVAAACRSATMLAFVVERRPRMRTREDTVAAARRAAEARVAELEAILREKRGQV